MPLQLGSRWCDQRGQEFVVQAIDQKDLKTWVSYSRTSDGSCYSCLAEAFIQRFREQVQ